MGRSLVLNATYEPLCVVPVRRAVVLVMNRKAEVVHAEDRCLRSEVLSVEVPSVIRLTYFVCVPFRRRAALSRRAVFLRDGFRCQYCGAKAENIDHVIPRSKGGPHIWENVVAACRGCNGSKRNLTPREAGLRLRTPPSPPSDYTWLAAAAGRLHPDWCNYLSVGMSA